MRQHDYSPMELHLLPNDTEHTVHTESSEDAEDWFVEAKQKLLDVNNWQNYFSDSGVNFTITDARGNILKRQARSADHVRIELPNVHLDSGFDWIVVESIEYDDYPDQNTELLTIRLLPAESPLSKSFINFPIDNHVFGATFILERRGAHLSSGFLTAASNEDGSPLQETEMKDNSWMGIPALQWDNIAKGIIS